MYIYIYLFNHIYVHLYIYMCVFVFYGLAAGKLRVGKLWITFFFSGQGHRHDSVGKDEGHPVCIV
jgi:hypothetical protein